MKRFVVYPVVNNRVTVESPDTFNPVHETFWREAFPANSGPATKDPGVVMEAAAKLPVTEALTKVVCPLTIMYPVFVVFPWIDTFPNDTFPVTDNVPWIDVLDKLTLPATDRVPATVVAWLFRAVEPPEI